MKDRLSGVRVVEIGGLPAGAYVARLFADFGAEVIKVEPPGGDPNRSFPPLIDGGSGWFAYLNYGKKSVIADKIDLDALLRGADVLIDSTGTDHVGYPHLVVVDLSWFGRSGPYRDFKASDAVCRALAGFVQLIGPQEGPPLTLPDYQSAIMGGLAAFIPAMAALLGRQSLRYEVSVHEATIALAEYQAIEAWATGTPQKRWGFNRFTPTYPMGVYRCKQGWIGVTIVTPAQWKSFCELLGMPDLGRHPQHVMGPERLVHADALEARFVPRFLDRTAEEWFAAGLKLRLPFAIVPDMKQVLEWPVFRDRKAIVPIKLGDRTVEAPGSPFHLTRTPANFGGTVPEIGEHNSCRPERSEGPHRRFHEIPSTTLTAGFRSAQDDRPLKSLRIIDLSMGWAGPICTRNLADLGADVIKIEACGYPDWWRGVDNRLETVTQRLYEKSSRFNIMNRGKRAITLDLTVPDGVALAKALVKDADAVIENYSAEVLRKFGLDYAELIKVNPSLVMVSMAAFGATGPWRETRAYGSTLEQGSGLPSVGGRTQDPPMMNHLAYGDAVGGLNACAAMLIALLHRRETGEGQFIDLSQVQCMLPFTAAWAIEQSANGKVAPRAGNRHPSFVPHGVFPSAGTDKWVSIAVTDDAMWPALARLIGLDNPALATAVGRRAQEDRIESAIAGWTMTRSPDEAMESLQ
jgi:crotonobetainyl-CoA:carnitine CoA-transferase CaiB-like acyl-CoA transferase